MTRYVTPDKVCKHGHYPERFISTGACCLCISEARDRARKNPEKRKRETDLHRISKKTSYNSNPVNRDKRLYQNSAWKRANPDKVRANNIKRNAIKRNAAGSFNATYLKLLIEEQGNTCPGCLRSFEEVGQSVDHFIPLIRGGTNDEGNIQLLCHSCNCSKAASLWEDWLPGITIRGKAG